MREKYKKQLGIGQPKKDDDEEEDVEEYDEEEEEEHEEKEGDQQDFDHVLENEYADD